MNLRRMLLQMQPQMLNLRSIVTESISTNAPNAGNSLPRNGYSKAMRFRTVEKDPSSALHAIKRSSDGNILKNTRLSILVKSPTNVRHVGNVSRWNGVWKCIKWHMGNTETMRFISAKYANRFVPLNQILENMNSFTRVSSLSSVRNVEDASTWQETNKTRFDSSSKSKKWTIPMWSM